MVISILADTTWVCRRRYTALIPKKEEGRNRLRQQCQLVDGKTSSSSSAAYKTHLLMYGTYCRIDVTVG